MVRRTYLVERAALSVTRRWPELCRLAPCQPKARTRLTWKRVVGYVHLHRDMMVATLALRATRSHCRDVLRGTDADPLESWSLVGYDWRPST